MATAEQYADWIVKNQDKKGTPEFETVAAAYKEAKGINATPSSSATPQQEKSLLDKGKELAGDFVELEKNIAGGLVRGAGSIGSTALMGLELNPLNQISDISRKLITGKEVNNPIKTALKNDAARREGMDAGLSQMGVDTNSIGFSGGKLAGEIAGTAGVPLAAGKVLAPVAPKLARSVASGGFRIGAPAAKTVSGKLADAGLRAAGGAIGGGAMTAAVDPRETVKGAVIGALVPNIVKGVGTVGAKLGQKAAQKAKDLAGRQQAFQAAKEAKELGYVIPPADLNPGMVSELASGASGKIKTAQFASHRNQTITNSLVKRALGLADDSPLDDVVLSNIRKQAGDAYQSVAEIGTVTPSAKYAQDLDDAVKPFLREAKSFPNRKANPIIDDIRSLKTDKFDAGDAIETIKVLRSEADKAYRGGDNLAGKAYKKAAASLEDAIDAQLVKNNAPADVLEAYRGARKTIAKTYTVEKALNPQTGNIDASKLAKELGRGKPLEGELLQVAKTAEAFPKATQMLKETPKAVSPLDIYGSTGLAVGSGNVLPLTMVGARPALRNILLSKPVQNRAINTLNQSNTNTGQLIEDAANSKLIEYLSRTAPITATQ